MTTKYRVWWVPQVPMQAFLYEVPTVAAGRMLCDALANYDLFQYTNNIKPDYSNVGGIAYCHPIHTDGEWYDWPDDEYEEAELIAELGNGDAR